MTLRKKTVDNSVRYVPKSEKRKETDIKPKKAGSLHCIQNKKISRYIKKFLNNLAANGFGILKCIMNCSF